MRVHLFVAAVVVAVSMSAHADTLASASGGASKAIADYQGQSFAVTGSGSFDDVSFNFYSYTSGDPFAAGTGYLFSTPFAGTPSGLSSADAAVGLLGTATSNGSVYSFDSSLTLTAGVEYYFYEDADIPGDTSGNSAYSGGTAYFTDLATENYVAVTSLNFLVTGQPVAASVTPEPSSFVLLGTGLLGAAGVGWRRKRLC